VWNAHNTVLGSKRLSICATVYALLCNVLCNVLCAKFLKIVQREIGEIVRYLPDQKNLNPFQTGATARIAPQVCQYPSQHTRMGPVWKLSGFAGWVPCGILQRERDGTCQSTPAACDDIYRIRNTSLI